MELSIRRLSLLYKRLFAMKGLELLVLAITYFLLCCFFPWILKIVGDIELYFFEMTYFIILWTIIVTQNDFNVNKENSLLAQLNLPASCLEKYILSFTYIFVLLNGALLFALFLSIPIGNLLIGNPTNLIESWQYFISFLSLKNWGLIDHFSLLFIFALTFFCSYFFKKNASLKTLVVILAFAGLSFLNTYLVDCNPLFMYDFIYENEPFLDYFNTMSQIMHQYMPILLTIASIFLFVLTYFRIKEERT
ncbi:MAG: hypothetical protein UHD64_06390 [Bacteroidales bacterium]|nr:hypothetical protein [Bacteroidales bacterium]